MKSENTKIKESISQLDENAVKRATIEKNEEIEKLKGKLDVANEELANIGDDYRTLLSKYKYLVIQWNEMKQHPEIIEALERVEKRKQKEAEGKREEQARLSRYQGRRLYVYVLCVSTRHNI